VKRPAQEEAAALPADPVVAEYRRHLDLSLIRKNLRLAPQERFEQLMELQRFARELRRAGREATRP
jgi:hypothetical protein